MRRTHLINVEVPQFHMAEMEQENFNSYIWQLGYRISFLTLVNGALSTMNGSVSELGGKSWTLRNTDGVLGQWLTALDLVNDGLRYTFNANPSSYGTFTGTTMPYLWINPVDLVPELESDLRAGECGPGQPIAIVIGAKDNANVLDERYGICVIDGLAGIGDGCGIFAGNDGLQNDVKWYRDDGGVVTSRSQPTNDKTLMSQTTGDFHRFYWTPRLDCCLPDMRDKSIWNTSNRAGTSISNTSNFPEGYSSGKIIGMGGFTGNVDGNLVVTVESLEVWYVPNFEGYDTV